MVDSMEEKIEDWEITFLKELLKEHYSEDFEDTIVMLNYKLKFLFKQNKQLQEELNKQEQVDLDIVYLKGVEDGKQVNKDKIKQLQAKIDKAIEYCDEKTIKTYLPLYTNEVIGISSVATKVIQILKEGNE